MSMAALSRIPALFGLHIGIRPRSFYKKGVRISEGLILWFHRALGISEEEAKKKNESRNGSHTLKPSLSLSRRFFS